MNSNSDDTGEPSLFLLTPLLLAILVRLLLHSFLLDTQHDDAMHAPIFSFLSLSLTTHSFVLCVSCLSVCMCVSGWQLGLLTARESSNENEEVLYSEVSIEPIS